MSEETDSMKLIELESILNEQERILDSMLKEQDKIHECVVKRVWDGLEKYIHNMSVLGSEFSKIDAYREKLASVSDDIYFSSEIRDVFLRVKSKLSKSKVENEALSKYVGATKNFITAVMEECIASQRNDVYTSNGSMRRNYGNSIVINASC